MTDESAYNLLIAITERAYKDYVIGLKLMRTNKQICYSSVGHYGFGRSHFDTAKAFLEGTTMGEYLMKRAEEEIKK